MISVLESFMPHHSFNKHSTAKEVTAGLDLKGKTALVTGSSAGIGYETMRVLAMRGALVYGLARTLEKATRACTAVRAASTEGQTIPFACDQTDFSSVVAVADAVRALGAPIDMLICNAGIYSVANLELAHGLEKQFVVNHLSHFILVNRLLDLVRSAPQGRIVLVGSEAHRRVPKGIEFDNLSGQRHYNSRRMYGQSKLANGLFVRELARRLAGSRVTVNVLHPGWVSTDTVRALLQRDRREPRILPRLRGHIYQLAHDILAKTPQQGAATTCYVATSPDLNTVSGAYFVDCRIATPGPCMQDDAMAAKLWEVSEELTRPYLRA
jgi:NAD(P)-dependent dehydrogenase (short-subunit alcohol dehydrogenase family)